MKKAKAQAQVDFLRQFKWFIEVGWEHDNPGTCDVVARFELDKRGREYIPGVTIYQGDKAISSMTLEGAMKYVIHSNAVLNGASVSGRVWETREVENSPEGEDE